MSWLSSLFTDNNDPNVLGTAVKGPGQSSGGSSTIDASTAALQQMTESARVSAAAALKAQTEANNIAAAASVPQTDSESARSAADNRRRRIMEGSSFGIGLPTQLGAPPVGFRMLAGQ